MRVPEDLKKAVVVNPSEVTTTINPNEYAKIKGESFSTIVVLFGHTMMSMAMSCTLFTLLLYLYKWINGTHNDGHQFNMADGFMMCAVSLSIFVFLSKVAFNGEYRKYWRRNVIGYALVCHKTADGKMSYKLCYSRKETRNESIRLSQQQIRVLVISLGGWFRRTAFCGEARNHWQVKVSSLAKNLNSIILSLSDISGSRQKVTISEALDISHFAAFCAFYARYDDNLTTLKERASTLSKSIVKAIAEIDATSRFKSMREAQAVRVMLMYSLLEAANLDVAERHLLESKIEACEQLIGSLKRPRSIKRDHPIS